MKITKKFVTGCIMAAAYAVYAAVWLYVLYHGLQPDGASFSQSAGENLQWEGTVMMVSEGILHLMFLLRIGRLLEPKIMVIVAIIVQLLLLLLLKISND